MKWLIYLLFSVFIFFILTHDHEQGMDSVEMKYFDNPKSLPIPRFFGKR